MGAMPAKDFRPRVLAEQRKVKPAKQRPWREVKEKMAAERYTYLRKLNFENQLGRSNDDMKAEADKYALDSVRSASAKAIKDELGE